MTLRHVLLTTALLATLALWALGTGIDQCQVKHSFDTCAATVR